MEVGRKGAVRGLVGFRVRRNDALPRLILAAISLKGHVTAEGAILIFRGLRMSGSLSGDGRNETAWIMIMVLGK